MKTIKITTIATFLLFAITNAQAQAYDHVYTDVNEGMRKVGLDCKKDFLGLGYSCEKYGFIDDKTNKVVVPVKYDYASSFSKGLAKVKLNDKYGFIDKTGKEIIAIKYTEISNFSEDGLAWVTIGSYPDTKYGFINKTGKEITAIKYDLLSTFGEGEEGLAMVQLKNKCGFIDKNGNEVIPLQYDGIWPFENGKAQVQLNGRIYYIDKNGNEVK